LANECRGSDVDAPGRLGYDEHLGLLHDLAPDDELLQVTARKAFRFGLRAAASDVEGFDARSGECRDFVKPDEPVADKAAAVGGQERVVRERHARYRTAAEALLRNEAQAEPAPRGRAQAARFGAADHDRVLFRQRLLAGDRRQQLLLSIARNARDADDLPAVNGEVHVL